MYDLSLITHIHVQSTRIMEFHFLLMTEHVERKKYEKITKKAKRERKL